MKNLLKNKKGFSLAEILLVVAIIVILSGATMIGIASMVNRSQAAASRAVASNANFEADAVLKVNKKKGMVNNEPFETETLNTGATENNQPTQTEAPTPTETKKEDPKPTKPSDTKPSDTKPSDTSKPTETTKAQGGGQQGGNSGGNDSYNKVLTSGSATVSADSTKTIKSITINYKNNQNNYSQFYVTYKGGPSGNFNNANNYVGLNGGETGSVTFTPSSNGQNLTGCTGLVFNHAQGDLTILGYTIEYE